MWLTELLVFSDWWLPLLLPEPFSFPLAARVLFRRVFDIILFMTML